MSRLKEAKFDTKLHKLDPRPAFSHWLLAELNKVNSSNKRYKIVIEHFIWRNIWDREGNKVNSEDQ